MTWFLLSFLAFLCFGLQSFCYKISAVRDLNSRIITFYFLGTSTILLWDLLFWTGDSFNFTPAVILLSCCDAVTFFISTITRIEALKFIPSYLVFTLLRISTCLVVAAGSVGFGEPLTWQIFAGLILTLTTAALVHSERKRDRGLSLDYSWGLFLLVVAIITSTTGHVITKLAAINTGLLNYMALTNTLTVTASLIELLFFKKTKLYLPRGSELTVSIVVGLLNILAWYCYLLALKNGPLNVAAIVVSLSFIVPVVLASVFFKEHLTPRQKIAIGLAVLAVVTLKM